MINENWLVCVGDLLSGQDDFLKISLISLESFKGRKYDV